MLWPWRAITGRHARVTSEWRLLPFPPDLSVSCSIAVLNIALSMLCQCQAMTSRSSYSARPSLHKTSKNPALDHCVNLWCTVLALPMRLADSALHWQPVLRTYTMASKIRRVVLGGLPAPARRWYCLPGSRLGWGIRGSMCFHNSSDTSQDWTCALAIDLSCTDSRLGP